MVLILCAALAGCDAGAPAASPDEFSVVLVTLDTTRADRIGAFGGTAVPTPHMDAAAGDGVVFEKAIAHAPLTLPSHASILTARYPASHGVRHNGVYKLPGAATTLTERLQAAGFHTAAFVAAFVLNSGFGIEQGFDVYDDIETSRYEGGRDNLYESRRSADEVNAAVFRWLDGRPEGRFFLWVHYYDPHHPYQAPETAGRRLDGSGYDRTISYMDACFGDLMDRLRRDGLLDSTILVVAGDHGESLGEHRELTHGIFLYDSVIRVPLFVRAPGLVEAGRRVEAPVGLVDVAPTVLELLDMPPLEEAEGASLVSRIRGEERPGALEFAETLMPRIEYGWSELRMVRDARWKYVQAPRPELYDLADDPGELNNLIAEEAELAADFNAELAEWVERTSESTTAAGAGRTLSEEEEARLRSLGYLGGGGLFDPGETDGLPDPKDRIDESLTLTRGRDLLAGGRPAEAVPLFRSVLATNPRNHLARNSLVQALIRLERLEEAEEEALAALAAAETAQNEPLLLEKARRTLASIYWMRGKNREAEVQYRMAIELNEANDHAAVFGGILLGAAGGMQEAMRIVEGVLERNPDDGIALAAKLELELGQGDREAAYATARKLGRAPAGDAATLMKAGMLARDFDDPPLAVRLFAAAAEREPDSPEILGHLGTALLTSGRYDEAERVLHDVHELAPGDPRPSLYLTNIALLRNDEPEARRRVDQALAIDERFIPPLLNLARWLAERRRFSEAEETVREALRRMPEHPEAAALLRQIEALHAETRADGAQARPG